MRRLSFLLAFSSPERDRTLKLTRGSYPPPLSARVRSHIVEGAHGEGKPVVFYVEDSFEIQ